MARLGCGVARRSEDEQLVGSPEGGAVAVTEAVTTDYR